MTYSYDRVGIFGYANSRRDVTVINLRFLRSTMKIYDDIGIIISNYIVDLMYAYSSFVETCPWAKQKVQLSEQQRAYLGRRASVCLMLMVLRFRRIDPQIS